MASSLPQLNSISEEAARYPNFEEPVPEKLKCPLCHRVIINPKQTRCGHRICESCIDERFQSSQTHVPCPLLGTEHDSGDCNLGWGKSDIHPDNFAKKEVMKLQVFCSNRDFGCDMKIPFRDLQAHMTTCLFNPVACHFQEQGCGERMAENKRAEHEAKCEYRVVQCQYCRELQQQQRLEDHLANCSERGVPCTVCNKEYPKSKEQRHRNVECRKRIGRCMYSEFGCHFEGVMLTAMDEHYEACVQDHLQLVASSYADLKDEISKIKESSLGGNAEDIQRNFLDQKTKVRHLQRNVVTIMGDISSLQETVGRCTVACDQLVAESIQRTTEVAPLQGSNRGGESVSGDIRNSVEQHDRQLALQDVRLAEFDIRLQALDVCSQDGTLVWKIRDFRRRKLEAVQGRSLSIYSPPFYTSRFGYKSCARIYLNGDGMGKGHHISLFFVVMKGEYDALLPWPFKQKVTLMLLDQTASKKHLSDTFRPDPNSSSFQRPTSDMNIASGCPQFASHEVLEKDATYVKDDTIFVRIKIDLEGLSMF